MCTRHPRAREAFAPEDAERDASASADTPSGRLEWVTARALNKQYESTDELLADVKRTWGVLEERWTRENEPSKLDALREVTRAFEHTWRCKGIGERGGLVCIPSVGITREAIELPRSSTPVYSHSSQVDGESVAIAVAAGASVERGADGRNESGHLVSKVDGKERATRRALETCARVIKTFIKTDAAFYFREPVDPVMMKCPDYLDVVKHPMDLSTLLERIESRALTTPLEVWEASKLIWDNCRLYNPKGNAIVNICDFAESQFVAAWRSEGLHKMVETSPEISEAPERSPPRKMSEASAASRQSSGMNRNWSSSSLMTAPPQERAGSKPSTAGRASYKCDVCKRSKKGRCGTDTAPKSCLSRPENQRSDRQNAILDRVSRLKPLQPKKCGDLKRKITEAQAQEDGFRTLFDENDPDNFISQFEAHQRQARQIDMSQQSLHLANEHLRLQTMQNHRLARLDNQMLSQASTLPRDAAAMSTASAPLTDEEEAIAVRLQHELLNIVVRLNRAYLNQQRCVKMLSRPELSPAHVEEVRRAQHSQQMIVHQLQKRHQECSKRLHAYVQRGYKVQQRSSGSGSDAGARGMPAPSSRTTTQRASAPPPPTRPTATVATDRAQAFDYGASFASGLNFDDVSVAVASVFNDDNDDNVDIDMMKPPPSVDINHRANDARWRHKTSAAAAAAAAAGIPPPPVPLSDDFILPNGGGPGGEDDVIERLIA